MIAKITFVKRYIEQFFLGGAIFVFMISMLFSQTPKLPIFVFQFVILIFLSIWVGVMIDALLSFLKAVYVFETKMSSLPLISLLTICSVLILTIFLAANPSLMSGETLREIGCILDLMKNSTDIGLNGLCHIAYPSIQFIVPALPSLFARTHFNLQIGILLYLVPAILYFSAALLQTSDKLKKLSDIVLGVSLLLIFNSYHFFQLLLTFEQSLYPTLFALMLIGKFFLILSETEKTDKTNDLAILLFLIWMSGNIYTPGLALVPLGLLMILYLLVKEKKLITFPKIILISFTFLSFLIRLVSRGDLALATDPNTSASIGEKLMTFLQLLFAIDGVGSFVSPLLTVPFLLMIIYLIWKGNWFYRIIALWSIAVMLMSIYAKGYAAPGVEFALHRATLIFPVILITFIFSFFYEKNYLAFLVNFRSRLHWVLIFVLTLQTAFYLSYGWSKHIGFNDQNALLENIYLESSPNSLTHYYILNSTPFEKGLTSIGDPLMYFNNGFIPLVYLESDFCQNILASVDKKDKMFVFLSTNSSKDSCLDGKITFQQTKPIRYRWANEDMNIYLHYFSQSLPTSQRN